MSIPLCTADLGPRDAYTNFALEKVLFETAISDCAYLFLWQNRNTVVIGRNQNCWSECRVAELEEDGGTLARRLTGGGAVYHDEGNLNFTLVFDEERAAPHLDRISAFGLVLDAVRSLGVDASLTGRNDLVANGLKFSGNAFLSSGSRYLHHGTILVDTDLGLLGRYLSPSGAKLASHGVASVRSRVCNLSSVRRGIAVSDMRAALVEAARNRCAGPSRDMTAELLRHHAVDAWRERFASPEWVYNRRESLARVATASFPWGRLETHLECDGTRIESVRLYSDSLDPGLCPRLSLALTGADAASLDPLVAGDAGVDDQMADGIRWVRALVCGSERT